MQMSITGDTCWIFKNNSQGIVSKIKVKKEGNLYLVGVRILLEQSYDHVHKVPFSEKKSSSCFDIKVWAPKSSIFTKDATRKNGLWGKNTSHNHVSSTPRLLSWKTTPRKFFGGWCFSSK